MNSLFNHLILKDEGSFNLKEPGRNALAALGSRLAGKYVLHNVHKYLLSDYLFSVSFRSVFWCELCIIWRWRGG